MSRIGDLEEDLQERLREAAKAKGVDPSKLRETAVEVDRRGTEVFVRWGDVELHVPGPTQNAVDSWWSTFGGFFAGALIALSSVIVGAGIAIAAAAAGGSENANGQV